MAITNKKHSLLHFPSANGLLLKRSRFLDGTLKTYFAPGQRPYMVGRFNPPSADVYKKPTKWPAAGRLIRAPQVVWLEIRIGAAGSAAVMADPFVHQWLVTAEPFDFLAWETQPNPGRTEHLRLAPIFAAAKAAIEAIRPDRTWVEVVDWNEEFNVRTDHYFGVDSPFTTTWVSLLDGLFEEGTSTGAGFITSPAFTGGYLGTDFFSIYCGDAFIQDRYMNDEIHPVDPQFLIGGSAAPTNLPANPYWAASYPQLKAQIDKFYGYSSRLYHPPFGYHAWLQKDFLPDPPDDESNITNATLDVWTKTAENFDAAASIALVDKIDITHPGQSTLIVNSADVVNLVAAHFGFNPQTGKDL